ncbi:hypothetical protein VN97_g8613 [Penicillium thymicola]|uniref:Uncharacterized protein n=1 Tax=Penicillium thymicola TaxID=293382 RepID=A0AAI9X5H9_PENTH|nr:hypothetical protein VN97_g8613 [Penicillium thymicola]
MHYIRGRISRICFLILASTVLAKEDPDYNPSSNFRPNNVTGLNQLYTWVGSYYNGTTEIELNPTMGYSSNETVCPTHRNRATILKWDSLLAVTQRGPYNSGINPANLWLILFPPNHNISDMPYEMDLFRGGTPLMYPVMSSLLTWKHQENTTVPDHFNLTTTKTPNSSFTLSGQMHSELDPYAGMGSWNLKVDMTPCNITEEYGNWTVRVPQAEWWDTEDWDGFVLPNVTADFDAHTSNLTMDGHFTASPYMRSNVSRYMWGDMLSAETIRGPIQVRFSGVLDAYNSDILDVNSTEPAWLRTVGFGNNSLNIADSPNGECSLRPALWGAFVVPLLVGLIVYT